MISIVGKSIVHLGNRTSMQPLLVYDFSIPLGCERIGGATPLAHSNNVRELEIQGTSSRMRARLPAIGVRAGWRSSKSRKAGF